MSATAIIIAVIIAVATVAVFLVGAAFGYGVRVREERDKYKEECIRSMLKHWHGHTTHRGCTIFSPYVKKGGIK